MSCAFKKDNFSFLSKISQLSTFISLLQINIFTNLKVHIVYSLKSVFLSMMVIGGLLWIRWYTLGEDCHHTHYTNIYNAIAYIYAFK
ncbi:Uncharacterised protein [uncultured archaeon]|nr:Uncharacterised protein [uncultured archaeon]